MPDTPFMVNIFDIFRIIHIYPRLVSFSYDHRVSAGRRFSVRCYCGREERQVTLRFPSASAPVSLHKCNKQISNRQFLVKFNRQH